MDELRFLIIISIVYGGTSAQLKCVGFYGLVY